MDKKSRDLNIITSATVTLLTKPKLKGLQGSMKKVKQNSMRGKLQERHVHNRDVVVESVLSIGIYECFAKIQVLVICTMFLQWNSLKRS